jgi:hypothetical protein
VVLDGLGLGKDVETGVIDPPPWLGSNGSRPENTRTCFGELFGRGAAEGDALGAADGATMGLPPWGDFLVALGSRKKAAAATTITTPKMSRARRSRGVMAMA